AADPSCVSDEEPIHIATISIFALDTFEVTVGRFRNFVNAYPSAPDGGTWSASWLYDGAGANPNNSATGWSSSWNSSLPANPAALKNMLNSGSIDQTWMDTAISAKTESY